MRHPDRRKDRARRKLVEVHPVLVMFMRGKDPKEIALILIGPRLSELRSQGRGEEAERLLRAKVRWAERRVAAIMKAV